MKRTALLRKTPLAKVSPNKVKKEKDKNSSSYLRDKLDKLFSQYIRRKYSDEDGMSQCYTCGAIKHYKKLQCGHFISRKELATRFDERNCRPQCFGCNAKHLGNGMVVKFGEKLEKEYGKKIITELHTKARTITKYFPYEHFIEVYTEKLKQYDI